MLRFHFPIVIIDEDFRSENTSGLGIRALAQAIHEARNANPAGYHADPEAVRALERDDDDGSPPTARGWAP